MNTNDLKELLNHPDSGVWHEIGYIALARRVVELEEMVERKIVELGDLGNSLCGESKSYPEMNFRKAWNIQESLKALLAKPIE